MDIDRPLEQSPERDHNPRIIGVKYLTVQGSTGHRDVASRVERVAITLNDLCLSYDSHDCDEADSISNP
jgi:hypothetical protein